LEALSHSEEEQIKNMYSYSSKTDLEKEVLKARRIKAMGGTHRKCYMILSALGTTESELA